MAGSWHCSCAPTWRGIVEGRFEDNGFAPHRLSTLCIFWLLFIFYPESMQLDLQRTWGVVLPFPIQERVFRAFAVLWFNSLEAASLHIHFPSCRVLHIFPIRHVCTTWLYTWQFLFFLYYSYSSILEEPDQLNYCTKFCTKCSQVVKGFCCCDCFCILYPLKEELSGDTDMETHLRLPSLLLNPRVFPHISAPQSDRGRVWT